MQPLFSPKTQGLTSQSAGHESMYLKCFYRTLQSVYVCVWQLKRQTSYTAVMLKLYAHDLAFYLRKYMTA